MRIPNMKRRTLSPAFLAALLGAIPVGGAEPPKTAAAGKEAVLLLTPPAPPEPRINGPKVYGVRHEACPSCTASRPPASGR
jgi:hypothetical protein